MRPGGVLTVSARPIIRVQTTKIQTSSGSGLEDVLSNEIWSASPCADNSLSLPGVTWMQWPSVNRLPAENAGKRWEMRCCQRRSELATVRSQVNCVSASKVAACRRGTSNGASCDTTDVIYIFDVSFQR